MERGGATVGVTAVTTEAQGHKEKAIALAVATIEKQFGKGAILTMTDEAINRDVESFSSGSISLDLALGIGGYPRGRVVEIYGPESSGKTTLALHAVAEVQRQGGVAAFIDAEHALDVGYARRLGVKVEDLLISQPGTGEPALEIVDGFAAGVGDGVAVEVVFDQTRYTNERLTELGMNLLAGALVVVVVIFFVMGWSERTPPPAGARWRRWPMR